MGRSDSAIIHEYVYLYSMSTETVGVDGPNSQTGTDWHPTSRKPRDVAHPARTGVLSLHGTPDTEFSASANRVSHRSQNISPGRKNITNGIHFRRSSWRFSRRTTWPTIRDTSGIGFFRPSGACRIFPLPTHGLRRGLHSLAAPRPGSGPWSVPEADNGL